jgi:tetratricopeptide (TPR) repeat protein
MSTELPSSQNISKTESWSFRILVAGIFLAPLAFFSTNYIPLDLMKTCVIVATVGISAILCVFVAWKERKISLPPRMMAWPAFAIVVSIIASAAAVHPIAKAFFGQGFELDTAGFMVVLFVALGVVYHAVVRVPERAVGIYVVTAISFFVLELFHVLRFVFGTGFASLGTLTSLTSTVFGGWYALAVYAVLILIVSLLALVFLPLSRGMKIIYSIVTVAAFVAAFFIGDLRIWALAALVFFGVALYATLSRSRPTGNLIKSWLVRIAWVPLLATIVCGVFAWKGGAISGPAITKIGASYSELQLPWQPTLDVAAGAIKDNPLLGAGPDRFSQAYIAHKPYGVNATDAWSVEFSSGFSTMATFFVNQGLLGIIAWIVFFVFFGIVGVGSFRRMSVDPRQRFVLVSSYASSVFLWLSLIVSVQPHVIVLFAFVMTGVFLGAAVSYGTLPSWTIGSDDKCAKVIPVVLGLFVLLTVFWMVVYAKDTIALAYYGSGVKALNVSGDSSIADADFSKALAFDNSDNFWQARAEAGIVAAQKISSSVTASSSASTTQAVATEIATTINQSLSYANKAIAYDSSNYYNYASEARVSSVAASISMANAYDNAVQAYTQAIKLDPQNPLLYLDLAQLQAQSNKLPDALQTLGTALQVKSNYLDAIYLLSQVEAAQGNVKDAITAAQVAIQINPSNPLLFFQLGLLQYNAASYSDAVTAFSKAVAIQPSYANAQYFLGLSYARLGDIASSTAQFAELASTNPDNQTVSSILTALQSGKSIFAPATTTTANAQSSKLPLKEKGQ